MPTPRSGYKNKNGERITGTTTIISSNLGWSKNQLMYWAWSEGRDGRDFRDTTAKAADAGTVAHYLVDCDIHGINADTHQFPADAVSKGETAYLNFLEWKDTIQFKPYKTEIQLVSEKYQYGATPDCIAFVKGKLCLLDWKSSGGVYPDHKIQLAAYKQAWEENFPGELIYGFHLVRFDKESAAFAHYYWQSLPEAWEAFLHLLELDKLRKVLK